MATGKVMPTPEQWQCCHCHYRGRSNVSATAVACTRRITGDVLGRFPFTKIPDRVGSHEEVREVARGGLKGRTRRFGRSHEEV